MLPLVVTVTCVPPALPPFSSRMCLKSCVTPSCGGCGSCAHSCWTTASGASWPIVQTKAVLLQDGTHSAMVLVSSLVAADPVTRSCVLKAGAALRRAPVAPAQDGFHPVERVRLCARAGRPTWQPFGGTRSRCVGHGGLGATRSGWVVGKPGYGWWVRENVGRVGSGYGR